MRAFLASYYVGTSGLDMCIFHSIIGIKVGESWERLYSRHSLKIYKHINVVNDILNQALAEEINLKITVKFKGKKRESETKNITQRYYKGIKAGIDKVYNVRMIIFFDMGW